MLGPTFFKSQIVLPILSISSNIKTLNIEPIIQKRCDLINKNYQITKMSTYKKDFVKVHQSKYEGKCQQIKKIL